MMLRKDLESAGLDWIKVASDDTERERRAESDRFAYTDDDGHVFDFHALRGQFITDLCRAGVSLQDAQKLARHSDPKLTASVYRHLSVSDLGRSVNKLPMLPSATVEQMKATGTDDTPTNTENRATTHTTKPSAVQCRSMPKSEQADTSGGDGQETQKPANPRGNTEFCDKTETRAAQT